MAWRLFKHAKQDSKDIVLAILSKHAPHGLSTKEIFNEAHTILPLKPAPPRPPSSPQYSRSILRTRAPPPEPLDHPIRSMRYLKTMLKELQQQQLVAKKIVPLSVEQMSWVERDRMTREGSDVPRAWRWRLLSMASVDKSLHELGPTEVNAKGGPAGNAKNGT